MKLLLDENLSRRPVPFLQDLFPGSSQVVLAGLDRATDRKVWAFAKEHNYVIVTNDADFEEPSVRLGGAASHHLAQRRKRVQGGDTPFADDA